MTLYISSSSMRSERLDLPMPLEEIKRKMEMLRAKDPSNHIFRIGNVNCPVPNLSWHLQSLMLDSDSTLQKLNQLAEAMDEMASAEHYHLNKALSTDYKQSLNDVLRTAAHIKPCNTSCYEVIPEITTHQALGKWLVEHDQLEEKVPESLLPHLDYHSIGVKYCVDHNGEFLTNGYVGIRERAMEQVLGEQGLLRLTLTASKGGFFLGLPASDGQLDQVKEALGIENFAQVDVGAVSFSSPHLSDLIPLDAVTVEEANELAGWLQELGKEDAGLLKFCAVLEVEQPDTFSKALTIAMDLDDYELVPADMNEYGRQVLQRIGADDELLDTIDGYMDFTQLGEDSMVEDGVRRTQFGLVRRLSAPYPQQEEIGPAMC